MRATIYNERPADIMFTLPLFYRVQANFSNTNEVCQFDYISEDSITRMQNDSRVAIFKIRPHKVESYNDLYERQC